MQSTIQNNQLEKEIWQQLLRASVDKHHEWRSPVLVTCGKDNWPDARTVILRAVDVNKKQLNFYTDSRSPKIAQLLQNPKAMLVFWSKRLNWQLRIKVNIAVQTEGEQLKKTWQKVSQSPSAGDYLSVQAPGDLIENAACVSKPSTQNKAYFALLNAHVIAIDWLALNREGHQRAKFDAVGSEILVP